MLNAIIILSALFLFSILFAIACLFHAKYTTEALKIMTEYAKNLKTENDSILDNQKELIENHTELVNRFTNLSQWTINKGLYPEDTPPEEDENVQQTYAIED